MSLPFHQFTQGQKKFQLSPSRINYILRCKNRFVFCILLCDFYKSKTYKDNDTTIFLLPSSPTCVYNPKAGDLNLGMRGIFWANIGSAFASESSKKHKRMQGNRMYLELETYHSKRMSNILQVSKVKSSPLFCLFCTVS